MSALLETSTASFCSTPSKVQTTTKPSDIFKQFSVVRSINKAKFPVYMINSKINKEDYAMKVFNYEENKPHVYFQNEIRFAFLKHPNIIKTHYIEVERLTISKGHEKKISYTIMEYAPHGDFFDLVLKYGANIDDKIIRTYFRQMIDGIEYLHKNNVSHMDLKLENLLLGKDFDLKIADFDLSYYANDGKILSKGTKFYRPPEIIQGMCKDTQAADIYSAGIILFTLQTRGILPHAEDNRVAGIDFAGLLYTQNEEFWKKHCEIQKKEASFFDEDFKSLFNSMITLYPSDRATIQEIKKSKWYNGPCYTNEELKTKVARILGN